MGQVSVELNLTRVFLQVNVLRFSSLIKIDSQLRIKIRADTLERHVTSGISPFHCVTMNKVSFLSFFLFFSISMMLHF